MKQQDILILLADKDLISLRLTSSVLRSAGYRVITTSSSDRVLDILKQHKPDILILEINIDGMDGLETCRFIRDKYKSTIPIIIQSKLQNEDVILRAFESGASDYLVKPTPDGILKAKIKINTQPSEKLNLQSEFIENEILIGDTYLGQYRILERIGGGSSANVYKAISKSTLETVAVKVLNQATVGDSRDIQRFFRGCLIGMELPAHPNLVQIFEIKKTEKYIYQVMEYVSGQTLFQIIKSGHKLREGEAIRVLEDICRALDHLHQNQVLHRDVKPGNIFIMEDWRCKLGDMGISRRVVDRTATSVGHVVGTPGYIAPEQIMDIRPLDIRVDIFALGVTMYHAVTGSNPLDRETAYASILARIEGPELVLTSAEAPQISDELCMVITKMTRRLPINRYDSPATILSALKIIQNIP